MIKDTGGNAVNPVTFEDGSFWFWDETWSIKNGPFNTYDEAYTACVKYAEGL